MNRTLETLVGGLGFGEGPAWHGDGWLVFSDIAGNRLQRWDPRAGQATVFREPSHKTNGNAWDAQGRLVSCEHATSRVVRLEVDGTSTVLASHYEGRELNSPNDLAFGRDGAVYFTDPTYGRIREDVGVVRELQLPFRGVYRIESPGRVRLLADDFEMPNGLCFSPDFSVLYVNDTKRMHIRRFEVLADGGVRGGEAWAKLEGDAPGVADGMKCDAAGNVYCTGPGGVHVFDAGGARREIVHTPERITNFAFGGADLYLTAPSTLYRIAGFKLA